MNPIIGPAIVYQEGFFISGEEPSGGGGEHRQFLGEVQNLGFSPIIGSNMGIT
jgi:hypothetical protein